MRDIKRIPSEGLLTWLWKMRLIDFPQTDMDTAVNNLRCDECGGVSPKIECNDEFNGM